MSQEGNVWSDRRILLESFDDGGLTAGCRDIHIYLPEGYYESQECYPVIYFSDGQAMLSKPGRQSLDVDRAYDPLIAEGRIKPCLFVGVTSVGGEAGRVRDMTPTVSDTHPHVGGRLESYYRFFAELLKPYIDRHFRTCTEPFATGIAGYSGGGLSAFLMAYTHPETFGMAGCMSPSLTWDDRYAHRLVSSDAGGKRPIRFWLDSGGGEYSLWSEVARTYDLLERKGWHAGDDIAAYFDYTADHSLAAGGCRMRDMLIFLLRREPLRLEDYRLVGTADPTANQMELDNGRRRLVGAEAHYAGGLRLTVPNPDICIGDSGVVARDAKDPLLLHGVAAGETVISSVYRGREASLVVTASDRMVAGSSFACLPVNGDTISAVPSEFPHAIIAADGTIAARFGAFYDPQHVHVIVHVRDVAIVMSPIRSLDDQDSVWIRLDARAETVLRKGEGYSYYDSDKFLHVGLGPGGVGEPFRADPAPGSWPRLLPAGICADCILAEDGYMATLSVPVGYLNQRQDGAWTVFRVNVCINDRDSIGGRLTETRWQPDWIAFDSPIGSGIFQKA